MWGNLPVSDAPIAGLSFHTAFTGGGPCHCVNSNGGKTTLATMLVTKSTLISSVVELVTNTAPEVLGG